MFLPYNVDVPMRQYPIANWAVITATCAVSLWLLTLESYPAWALNTPGSFSIVSILGSLFAHAGPIHLIGNMIFLFVFGNAVNAKLGHLPFLALYFVVGLVEGVVWSWLGSAPSLGASGAIMGVVGAFLVFYPRNDVSVGYWFAFFAHGSFSVSACWVVAAYVAFDIWGLATGGSGGVAYLSHVTGALTGFGLALGAAAAGLFPSERHEENILEALGVRKHPDTH